MFYETYAIATTDTNTSTTDLSTHTLDEALDAALRGDLVYLLSRTQQGTLERMPCWVADGELVMPHPTEPSGTVGCRPGRDYSIVSKDACEYGCACHPAD